MAGEKRRWTIGSLLTSLIMLICIGAMVASGPFFSYQAWRGFAEGETLAILADGATEPVAYAGNPGHFWFVMTVNMVLGGTGLIIDLGILLGVLGKIAGLFSRK